MLGTLSEVFPSAEHQRCTVVSCRNVLAKVPKRRRKAVAAQPEATRAQESLEASAYARSPPEHRRRIRTNNGNKRPSREARRRTKVIARFHDSRVAMMLAAARCKYIAEGNWEIKRYLDANLPEG